MNVAVVLGSHRSNGTSLAIENRIKEHYRTISFDFIRMSETEIKACIACEKCSSTGNCVFNDCSNDHFNEVLQRLIKAEYLLIITPVYSPYPSRLIALFERLLSISFFPYLYDKRTRPLHNKQTGIVCYGSSKIEDDKELKILFQKVLMDEYSFFDISYSYINRETDPNSKYSSVIEYVDSIVQKIATGTA